MKKVFVVTIKRRFIVNVNIFYWVILIALFVSFTEAQRIVTIRSPKCNLTVKAIISASECCCPSKTTDSSTVSSTATPTQTPNWPTNMPGRMFSRVGYEPQCSGYNIMKYPGIDCRSYYICNGTDLSLRYCRYGRVYSIVKETCVRNKDYGMLCIP
ncbi:hypothetical protein RN001_000536 [Aquatica leii]|uniref:Chitin-binding type-2 domain-containing protein n=1 Tax=Aquatica leii TaxID=1421715 RepID=A0AAN7SSG7_9COLE|nr:hypothetical protein RN001_000536 [Aquatica leii]